MRHRIRPLALAIPLIVTATPVPWLHANETDADRHDGEPPTLPAVAVSALPLGEDESRIAVPYSIVSRDKLFKGATTLGDALNDLPGVHADTFGGGASRPVIRGQSAPRVKVLSDSSSILDASDISPDHAVTVDPLLAQRIEVLNGPAALLYGSGAVGGVVNVLDDKIPTALPAGGIDGSVVVRGNTVANERAGAAALTFQAGSNLAIHAEGSSRNADDYRVPGWDERRVDGAFSKSKNGSVGLSWIGDGGYIGLAYSQRDDNYGLPGHEHEYEGCHPHDATLHCDDHDLLLDDGHEREAPPTIDLLSRRLDLRGESVDPMPGIERIRFRFGHTDYRHHEIEDGEIATTFRNEGHESRIEVQHAELGPLSGVIGIQHAATRFSTEGEEAFLPHVDTRSTGLFVVEHAQISTNWHVEFGARREWLRHETIDDPRNRPDFDGAATSLSAASVWELMPDLALTLSAARSERLPHAQEIYARGVHLATNTYECGMLASSFTCGGTANDRDIEPEVGHNIDVGLRKTEGPLTFSLSAFVNHADHYVYARTLDQFEDFRLVKYTQADAKFRGFEAEASWQFSDTWKATLFGDHVRATLADGGGNLPRIAPSRIGVRVAGQWEALSGEAEYYRVDKQSHIADYETQTPGYDMLNVAVSYAFGEDGKTSVFLRGNNLLDEQVWNHTSFLARAVPLPGRNITVGFRHDF